METVRRKERRVFENPRPVNLEACVGQISVFLIRVHVSGAESGVAGSIAPSFSRYENVGDVVSRVRL